MTQKVVHGWAEILLRLQPETHLRSQEDLDQDDYAMFGSPVPLAELDNAFGLYLMYRKHDEHSLLPRELRKYDVINIVINPGQKIYSRLLIDDADIPVLGKKGDFIEALPTYPLKLFPLAEPFKSFVK